MKEVLKLKEINKEIKNIKFLSIVHLIIMFVVIFFIFNNTYSIIYGLCTLIFIGVIFISYEIKKSYWTTKYYMFKYFHFINLENVELKKVNKTSRRKKNER